MTDADDLLRRARELADGPLSERAAGYDETRQFPIENYSDLHRAGLLALTVGRDHGGRGADWHLYTDVVRTLASGCASTALTFNMHSTVLRLIDALGSPEQKEEVFGAVVDEGALVASLTSEPQSSLRGRFQFQTRATVSDDSFVINGMKHFASLAPVARWYFTWAIDEQAGGASGLYTVLVPAGTPGLTIHETWNTMSMRATASHSVEFKDVTVPRANQVGQAGELATNGFTDMFTPGYCSVYTGVAEAAYRFTVDYATSTVFAPETLPISHYPAVQRQVAEMSTRLAAARQLIRMAAEAATTKTPTERVLEFNQTKLFACQAAREVVDIALDVCGGRALSKKYPLERYIRDAHTGNVMSPDADSCRDLIAKKELGISITPGFLQL